MIWARVHYMESKLVERVRDIANTRCLLMMYTTSIYYDRSMAPKVPFRRSCSGGAQPGGHDYFFVCGAAPKAARIDLGHTCNEYHRSSKNHAVTVSTATSSAVFEEGLAASADTHGMIGIREVQDSVFFIGLRMFACVGT